MTDLFTVARSGIAAFVCRDVHKHGVKTKHLYLIRHAMSAVQQSWILSPGAAIATLLPCCSQLSAVRCLFAASIPFARSPLTLPPLRPPGEDIPARSRRTTQCRAQSAYTAREGHNCHPASASLGRVAHPLSCDGSTYHPPARAQSSKHPSHPRTTSVV